MRYLGLDLGTKTLGISISDKTGNIASTYTTLKYDASVMNNLKAIIEQENISKIILGFPKNMNNSIGDSAMRTLDFKKKIEEELNMEVIMQDERLTTVEATNYMLAANLSRKKRKKKIDSLAANIILQTYLDRRDKSE